MDRVYYVKEVINSAFLPDTIEPGETVTITLHGNYITVDAGNLHYAGAYHPKGICEGKGICIHCGCTIWNTLEY